MPLESDDQWRRHAFWGVLKCVQVVHRPVAHDLDAPQVIWAFPDGFEDEMDKLKASYDGSRPRNQRGGPRGKRQKKVFIGPIDLGPVYNAVGEPMLAIEAEPAQQEPQVR